ncbi:kinase-like protein [Neoconidiobolus thromboides FSU 785]|nr:kinase-like protein [Neoconidiobolus thromboides FSU 785]
MSQIKETRDAQLTETEQGELKINQYLIKESIGKGSYGIVSLAIDTNTNQEYAAKEFSKSRLRRKKFSTILRPSGKGSFRGKYSNFKVRAKGIQRDGEAEDPMDLVKGEIAIFKKLHHRNVVKLFEVLDAKGDDMIYMMFEMCSKGPILNVQLNNEFEHFDLEKSRYYFKELTLGVEYLHENGIAHRDLKPDNLLIASDDTLKIVDFGVSEIFEKGHDKLKNNTGSPAFMAPEMLNKTGEMSATAIDIWAMGIILYCMTIGKMPFKGSNVLEIRDSIIEQELQLPTDLDSNLVDLLKKLLDKNPDTRITMEEIRVHPWLTNNGLEPLISLEENVKNSVTEITDNDLTYAMTSIGSVFKVIQAVNRFKHLRQMSKDKSDSEKS